ncbi:uncharacterized protein LOC127714238 [Mytilus californianus]|uniref:uncharacterized protein LOC127714238 n=1 Tax=Mytilus californianus TaxID=6549 RepID=UPI002246D63B|nr:uncharacterized protein LOC127714238 [Mytilus californianus]
MDADSKNADIDRLTNELIEAAKNGDLEAVNKCIQKGALTNYVDQSDNLTALHYASANGHREIVSILLDNGFDLNALTPDGWTILHIAALYGHKEIVSDLLDRGLNPNKVTRTHGVSVLHCAVENGQKEIVSELLHNDCDLHRVTDYGRTVLHWAADNGHIEIVSILLDKELDLLNHVDKDGWLALHLAAQNGIMDIVSELLRRGSDSNAVTSDGNTALHLSSSTGHKEVVTVLLDHAADPNAKNEEGNTALHLSARNRHKDVVLILLDNAADPNAVDADGNTPLILSAVIGHKEIVSILLDKDADPNAKNVDGYTALHYAATHLKRDIVSILVQRGAKLDSSTTDGETALDLVSYRCLPKTRRRSQMKSFLQEEIQKDELLQQLRGLGLETASDLQDLLLDSSFKSYWNRIYLVGPYSVGKSCLAKVLVGEQVPESKESTDGIWICMGKAGMDVDEMKWIYFEKGNAATEILTTMLMSLSSAEVSAQTRVNTTNVETKQRPLETKQKCKYQGINVDEGPNKSSLVSAEAGMSNASSHKLSERGITDKPEDMVSFKGKCMDVQQFEKNINSAFSLDVNQDECGTDNQPEVVCPQSSSNDEKKAAFSFDSSMKKLIQEVPIIKERNRSSTETLKVTSGNFDSEWMKDISSDMSKDKIHELMIKAVKEGKYKQKIVPIDIWDFGGQKDYHMTHQLFITSRGIFILMFNGSIGIHKHQPDLGSLPGHFGKPTVAVYLLHWVNSILTFCKRSKEGFPKIIFVATHKDMVSWVWKWRFESYRRKIEDEIQTLFKSHAGLRHLEFRPLLFINSLNPEDPEIIELQHQLMKKATEHPRWGEEMPTAWIPLDLQLIRKAEEGINVITREQLRSLNSKNESMVLSEQQIETFLEVQHSIGKLLYFNVKNLRDYVIISPVYLVGVLTSLVTAKQFWPKRECFPRILKNLQTTGFIDKEDIYYLWTQEEFRHILEYKDYMVDLLVHLDVIIAPRTSYTLSSNPLRDVSRFLVPCMITKTNDTKYLEKLRNCNNSIVMAYNFIEEVIPPALSYRFLGSLVTMWHIKKYTCIESNRVNTQMLFSDLYVVEVDNSHDIVLQVKGNRVVVSLVHAVNKKNIITTLASSIQECLTTAMHGICEFYSTLSDAQNSSEHQPMPFEIEFGVFCKSDICYFHHKEIRLNSPWFCSQHRKNNEVGYLQAWFSEKEPSDDCLNTCKGLGTMSLEQCPSDKHLRRLVGELSPGKCRELAIELGLKVHEWENFETQFQNQISDDFKFVAVQSCTEKSRDFTFSTLVRVLEILELTSHLLCKVLRDVKPDVSEILEDTLNSTPSPIVLLDLSNRIGNSTMQLALELDVDASTIQQIQYKHKNKLLEQTKEILQIWSKKQQPKPTLLLLIKALHRIGKMGSLRGITF